MVERRDKTTTEGRGLGPSWADDNVVRGEPGVDFEKRRPRYPWGDDPRGREIDFVDTTGKDGAGPAARNPTFRAYRGRAPLEGQNYQEPKRVGSLPRINSIRPELPNRSIDFAAHERLQEQQRGVLAATGFQALFPTVSITSPVPGATFAPGDTITIEAPASDLRSLFSATLEVDNQAVERRVINRQDQDSTPEADFRFIYQIPANRAPGPMSITVRAFNMAVSARGHIADDALGTSTVRTGLGTLDGRPGSSTSAADYQKLLNETGLLRTPEGVVSITVNIV
jgi:hypothetical protein